MPLSRFKAQNIMPLALAAGGILSGGVFSFGIPAWVLPLTFLPLIHVMVSLPSRAFKKSAISFLLFVLPFHGTVYIWMIQTDVSSVLKNPLLANFMVRFSWLVLVTVLSVAVLPVLYLLRKLLSTYRSSVYLNFLILPITWAVIEWTRSLVFSIFLYGDGASIGDYWNFGSLGLALMNTPLASLSRIIGMYGLGMVCIALAYGLYNALIRKSIRILGIVVLSLAAVFVIARLSQAGRPQAKSLSASTYQQQLPAIETYQSPPIENQSQTKKDLIVLPEYSDIFLHGSSATGEQFVNNRLAEDGVSISVSRGIAEKWYGTLEFRDKNGSILQTQTKELLIPTGEYMPSILSTFYRATGQNKLLNKFDKDRRVYKGDPPKVFSSGSLTVGPVACSGILGRSIYRQLTRDGAEVLTNSASLVMFNHSEAYFNQSLMMARFHAVANNRTYIQASRGASSFVIGVSGEFIVSPETTETKFLDFTLEPRRDKTIYTRFGEWPLVISFLFISGLALLKVRRRS